MVASARQPSVNFSSVEKELTPGKQLAQQTAARIKPLYNAAVSAYVERIARQLAAQIPRAVLLNVAGRAGNSGDGDRRFGQRLYDRRRHSQLRRQRNGDRPGRCSGARQGRASELLYDGVAFFYRDWKALARERQ